jgi:hypothetical protein
MPLSTAEVLQAQAECGYNVLGVGADVYVSVLAFFRQVVKTYLDDEVTTTATLATPISATQTPAPQTLTLADATGFTTFDQCVIDVDSRSEVATLSNLSGSDATFLLSNAHSGTIPVSVVSPVSRVREILARIRAVKDEMAQTFGTGSLKAVDEIEFYGSGSSSTAFGNLGDQLKHWRCELAAALGVPLGWDAACGGGSAMVVY